MNIFISYRRDDSIVTAKLIRNELVARFGVDHVFMDINDIGYGDDFVEAIDTQLARADVVLVVIGPHWAEMLEKQLRGDDWVRHEVAGALRLRADSRTEGPRVIPVLVGGATLPINVLHSDIAGLQRLNLQKFDEGALNASVNSLIEAVQQEAFEEKARSLTLGALGGNVLISVLEAAGNLLKKVGRGLGALPTTPPDTSLRQEPVLLGAAAPQTVSAGDEFTVRFVAHVAALEDQVRKEIKDLSPSAKSHLRLKTCQWQPGTRLKVALRARELEIQAGEHEFVWEGTKNIIEFDVAAPRDAKSATVVLKLDVSVDGIIVASLRLDLQIAAAHANVHAASSPTATVYGNAAKTAFASYASQDRLRVLDRVAAVRISAGLDIFLDCMSLHPGKEWEPQLERQIRKRDIFLLFWSAAARESPWVTWEWRTALKERGKDAMQIHPLEADAPPPEELKGLHFGDVYMLIREGQLSSATPTSISG